MPLLIQILRSRWFAACVHAGLWLLLYLVLTDFKEKTPDFRETQAQTQPATSPAPVARLAALFAPGVWPLPESNTNRVSPFFTRHFVPPPTPAPPPPTTRKFELTYLGFYRTGNGLPQAMIRMTNDFLIAPLGNRVLSNLFAAEVSMQNLVLTNSAGQTNALPLNVPKQVEVPIQ